MSNVSELSAQPSPKFMTAADEYCDSVFEFLGIQLNTSVNRQAIPKRSAAETPWVLLIEDDDDFVVSMKMRMDEINVKCRRASAGSDGYRRAFLYAPTAIILDYNLPHGNGAYVLRRLKETPATKDIPVIVVTGRREPQVARQMLSLGASEFLTKPYDWKRLRSLVMQYIDG